MRSVGARGSVERVGESRANDESQGRMVEFGSRLRLHGAQNLRSRDAAHARSVGGRRIGVDHGRRLAPIRARVRKIARGVVREFVHSRRIGRSVAGRDKKEAVMNAPVEPCALDGHENDPLSENAGKKTGGKSGNSNEPPIAATEARERSTVQAHVLLALCAMGPGFMSEDAVRAYLAKQTPESLQELSTSNGVTPLMTAAQNAPEFLDLLLPISSPDAQDGFHKTTALMLAAQAGQTDAVEMVAPVANCALANDEGRSALMLAAAMGNIEELKIIAPFSDARQVNHDGRTALMMVAGNPGPGPRNAECAQFLAERSDLEQATTSGRTALSIAMEQENHRAALPIARATDWPAWFKTRMAGALAAPVSQSPGVRQFPAPASAPAEAEGAASGDVAAEPMDDQRAFEQPFNPLSFLPARRRAGEFAPLDTEQAQLIDFLCQKLLGAGHAEILRSAFSMFAERKQWRLADAVSPWARVAAMERAQATWVNLKYPYGMTEADANDNSGSFEGVMPQTAARLQAAQLREIAALPKSSGPGREARAKALSRGKNRGRL